MICNSDYIDHNLTTKTSQQFQRSNHLVVRTCSLFSVVLPALTVALDGYGRLTLLFHWFAFRSMPSAISHVILVEDTVLPNIEQSG